MNQQQRNYRSYLIGESSVTEYGLWDVCVGLDYLYLFYLMENNTQTVIMLERSTLNIIYLLSLVVLFYPRDTSSDGF